MMRKLKRLLRSENRVNRVILVSFDESDDEVEEMDDEEEEEEPEPEPKKKKGC